MVAMASVNEYRRARDGQALSYRRLSPRVHVQRVRGTSASKIFLKSQRVASPCNAGDTASNFLPRCKPSYPQALGWRLQKQSDSFVIRLKSFRNSLAQSHERE